MVGIAETRHSNPHLLQQYKTIAQGEAAPQKRAVKTISNTRSRVCCKICFLQQALWCGQWELNPHAEWHRNLNPARLPIPSCPQVPCFRRQLPPICGKTTTAGQGALALPDARKGIRHNRTCVFYHAMYCVVNHNNFIHGAGHCWCAKGCCIWTDAVKGWTMQSRTVYRLHFAGGRGYGPVRRCSFPLLVKVHKKQKDGFVKNMEKQKPAKKALKKI